MFATNSRPLCTSSHIFHVYSDLKIKLQDTDTELGNTPLEVAGARVASVEVDWRGHDLSLVVDVVVAVQIRSSKDGAVDALERGVQTNGERNALVEGVGDLEEDGVELCVDGRDPVERVDVAGGVGDWQSLGAAVAGEHPLQPVGGALDGVGVESVEGDHVWGPVHEVAVLEGWGVGGHLDGVWVALGGEKVERFTEGGEEAWVDNVGVRS